MYIAMGLFAIVGSVFYSRLRAEDAFVIGQVGALQSALEMLGKRTHSSAHAHSTHAGNHHVPVTPAQPRDGLAAQDDLAI